MKAQCLSLDRISTLPPTVVQTILCFLPIQEAVRTCVLSKKWRYTWTTIPKLVFNEDLANLPQGELRISKRYDVFYDIYQVLLMHQGPIYEFTLDMNADDTCTEIDRIIFHLLRYNSLKKFTLDMRYLSLSPYRVPLSIFLLHHLTDLYLRECSLDHLQTSIGFVNLTSLHVEDVYTTRETILHLISKCPLLKSFTMIMYVIMKPGLREPSVSDLFECLPVIEHLTINIFAIECFVGNVVPRDLPASLVHLKYLCLKDMSLVQPYGLQFLVLLMQSSPNLEKIKLQMLPPMKGGSAQDCTDIWLNFLKILKIEEQLDIWLAHLNELEIEYFSYRKPELEFVKLILAKAPLVKKVRISLHENVANHEELKLCKILLRSPRASPQVEIIVERPGDDSICVGSNYVPSQYSWVR